MTTSQSQRACEGLLKTRKDWSSLISKRHCIQKWNRTEGRNKALVFIEPKVTKKVRPKIINTKILWIERVTMTSASSQIYSRTLVSVEKVLRSESNPLHSRHFKTGLKSFKCTSTKHCTALKSSRIMNMSANMYAFVRLVSPLLDNALSIQLIPESLSGCLLAILLTTSRLFHRQRGCFLMQSSGHMITCTITKWSLNCE